MLLRQLFDTESSTYTYLLADENSREALFIDPVREHIEEYLTLLENSRLTLKYSLETHVHADHVTAAGLLREKTGCQVGLCDKAGILAADLLLKEGDAIILGSHKILVLETPGHTPCSACYLAGSNLFTGDTLLINGCGRTDFQGGSAEQLWHSITQKIFKLPPDTRVYPAHDYHQKEYSTIAQEKIHNPRFGSRSREEFITLMKDLKLEPPQKIKEAVPANKKLGLLA